MAQSRDGRDPVHPLASACVAATPRASATAAAQSAQLGDTKTTTDNWANGSVSTRFIT